MKLWTAIVAAGLVLGSGCERTTVSPEVQAKTQIRNERGVILRSTVKVLIDRPLYSSSGEYLYSQAPSWTGSGTIVKRIDRPDWSVIVYVLTAKHVTDQHGKFFISFHAPSHDWTAPAAAEVFQSHPERDLALLRCHLRPEAGIPLFEVAPLALGRPILWEPVLAAGVAIPDEILVNAGELVGECSTIHLENPYSLCFGDYLYNAEIFPGYSGGGLWVRQRGAWRLVGVNVMISMYGWEPAPEQAWAEPWHAFIEWFVELGW